jgi:hypothetical protein
LSVDLEEFAAYARFTDRLIEQATKEQLADVARMLALNVGCYQNMYGEVPQDVLLQMAKAETLESDTAPLLAVGMQNLLSALAEIMGLRDDLPDEARH